MDGYLYCNVKDDGVGIRENKPILAKEKKRYSSTIVIRERLDILNRVEGAEKNKIVFNQEENPDGHSGFKSEIWVPTKI